MAKKDKTFDIEIRFITLHSQVDPGVLSIRMDKILSIEDTDGGSIVCTTIHDGPTFHVKEKRSEIFKKMQKAVSKQD